MRNGAKPLENSKNIIPKNVKNIPKGSQTPARQPVEQHVQADQRETIASTQQQYNNIKSKGPP